MRLLNHRSLVSLLAATLLAVGSLTGFPRLAVAHDSLAPAGAPHQWLPHETWVMRHWIPFDEGDLEHTLRLRGRELEAYLYDDHRTLVALAARRGFTVDRLADTLLAKWPVAADGATASARHDHAVRVLTQGHLAQHVFFHFFHMDFQDQGGPGLFGLSDQRYWRLRKHGRTPLQIARRAGVSPNHVRVRMTRLLHLARDQGVAQGLALPSEADRILARQLRALSCWMRSPLSVKDATNPYGKGRLLHPRHRRDWPATAAQRRADERRVERVRRSLPQSCWRRPPMWSWSTWRRR